MPLMQYRPSGVFKGIQITNTGVLENHCLKKLPFVIIKFAIQQIHVWYRKVHLLFSPENGFLS